MLQPKYGGCVKELELAKNFMQGFDCRVFATLRLCEIFFITLFPTFAVSTTLLMLSTFQSELAPRHVTLVAVSKTQSPERIMELYQAGQRIFGENRVQELLEKQSLLPSDIEWHLIGHLQTNKVKQVVPFVRMIHSVDSLRLLQEIDRQAAKQGCTIDCLLQFHIAQEETKFGLDETEARALLTAADFSQMRHIRICGVMGMASFSDDKTLVRSEFRTLHGIFERLQSEFFADAPYFRQISMGMSGDWRIAIEEGSTMVRIGSALFSNDEL